MQGGKGAQVSRNKFQVPRTTAIPLLLGPCHLVLQVELEFDFCSQTFAIQGLQKDSQDEQD
jgi:hypothetical protein